MLYILQQFGFGPGTRVVVNVSTTQCGGPLQLSVLDSVVMAFSKVGGGGGVIQTVCIGESMPIKVCSYQSHHVATNGPLSDLKPQGSFHVSQPSTV